MTLVVKTPISTGLYRKVYIRKGSGVRGSVCGGKWVSVMPKKPRVEKFEK